MDLGSWVISPNSVPVVVQSDDDIYTMDPTYRKFLTELEDNEYPDIVLVPANDGMLHMLSVSKKTTAPTTARSVRNYGHGYRVIFYIVNTMLNGQVDLSIK